MDPSVRSLFACPTWSEVSIPETFETLHAVGNVPPEIAAAVRHAWGWSLVEDEHRLDDRARFSVGGRLLDLGKRIVPDQLLQG